MSEITDTILREIGLDNLGCVAKDRNWLAHLRSAATDLGETIRRHSIAGDEIAMPFPALVEIVMRIANLEQDDCAKAIKNVVATARRVIEAHESCAVCPRSERKATLGMVLDMIKRDFGFSQAQPTNHGRQPKPNHPREEKN